jgi:HAE1 family hydrophobic/amphiphilic exporter-1
MSLAATSIKRPIFISCVFLLTLAVGFLSISKLPVDLFPDVTFPVVTVFTPYPGAGPKEIETLVTKIIEDELSSISGLKALHSSSKEGVSVVVAEFSLKTDVKYAEQQVRDKMSGVRRKLPKDVLDYTIRRLDPADQPILILSVAGEENPGKLYDYASEVIKPQLQKINQVGLVEIIGGRKREIHVELDQDKLSLYQLSAQQVVSRINAAGQNIPAGKVESDNRELIYRTLAEFQNPQEIASTIVNFIGNEMPVRISQLGTIKDSFEDEKSRVYYNGDRSLTLFVFKQSGSNTISVVNEIYKKIDEINLRNIELKANYKLIPVRDNSRLIKYNIEDVSESIFLGIFLTFVVVLFFLGNLRSTLITSIALPNSLLGAFILMWVNGFSINIMTLLALSLSIGLLIDDAIVVRENIYRHIEEGMNSFKAAFLGTKEVTLAVIATSFTVIAVFGPIAFLDGVVGQFFKQFGLTVCFAMLISLFDALTMAPMLSAYFAQSGKGPSWLESSWALYQRLSFNILSEIPLKIIVLIWALFLFLLSNIYRYTLGYVFLGLDYLLKRFGKFQDYLEDLYEKTLRISLKVPILTLLFGLFVFIASLALIKHIPKTFIPPPDNGEYQVSIELPAGSTLDQTQKSALAVEEVFKKHDEIAKVLTMIGNRDGENNRATFTLILKPANERKVNTVNSKENLRQELKSMVDIKPVVSDIDMAGAGQRPFNLILTGPILEDLDVVTQKVFEKLKVHPALKDVSTSSAAGKPEFQMLVDPEKAQRFGVSTSFAGAELRTLVEGSTAAVLRENGLEYDIRVRSQPDQRDLKKRLAKIFVPNINYRPVPFSSIARFEERTGPASINRENRSRSVTLTADISPDGPGMGNAIEDIKLMFTDEIKLKPGMSYVFSGQAENFQELISSMVIALGLGILFIYLVLSSLYESFITPFTIMLVLPLALCGAFVALFITQKSLDLFSMIGCIMLMGVATKNSILLVDYTKQLMDQGVPKLEALIKAGRTRLRPILMTSFALIAGMLPIAIGLNEASRQRTSMGVAIIGGLLSSTFLTLIVIPAAFIYIESFNQWLASFFKAEKWDELEKAE